jgi:geranylgeranyl transferase type-2 subunit beta
MAGLTSPLLPADLGARAQLLVEKHGDYIKSLAKIWEVLDEPHLWPPLGRAFTCRAQLQASDRMEAVATEHFWMSGMYWGLTTMYLLGR